MQFIRRTRAAAVFQLAGMSGAMFSYIHKVGALTDAAIRFAMALDSMAA